MPKTIYHGLGPSLDVNHPGDFHWANQLHYFHPEAPQCVGVKSGEAEVEKRILDVEIPEYELRGNVVFDKIMCPDSCPRDIESIRARCLETYWEDL